MPQVKLVLTIELDRCPGFGQKAEDFVGYIQKQIPDYYLKNVEVVSPDVRQQRIDTILQEMNNIANNIRM